MYAPTMIFNGHKYFGDVQLKQMLQSESVGMIE